MMKRVRVERRFFIRVIIILIILLFLLFFAKKFTGNVVLIDYGFNYENEEIKKQEIAFEEFADKLPDSVDISLSVYSYSGGEKIVIDEYWIKNGRIIREKLSNPDIIISIHSKYFYEKKDFCQLMQDAIVDGEIMIDIIDKSIFSLQDYKEVMECFGF